MQPSNIAWTDQTWNPTHGCSKASAGCENCYAEHISRQYERGTALTVKNEEFGVYEQREIRDMSDFNRAVIRARESVGVSA